jgi:uncharacterized protein
MQNEASVIGLALRERRRVWMAAALGVLIVAGDMGLSFSHPRELLVRFILGCSAVGGLVLLAGGDLRSLGLALRPARGWRYWVVASAVAAVGIFGFSLVVVAFVPKLWVMLVERGEALWISDLWPTLIFSCVQTPIVEELLYRGVLCAALVQAIGRTPTIVLSGVVFALLHVVYDNPGPDNAIAGFILGWAFLASRTLLIPVLMHAGGNLLVLLIQLMAFALTR